MIKIFGFRILTKREYNLLNDTIDDLAKIASDPILKSIYCLKEAPIGSCIKLPLVINKNIKVK